MSSLLDTAVERRPMADHEGKSGALLERVRLADGSRFVLKHISPETDLSMGITHDLGRAAQLWLDGTLRRLPPGIDTAIVDAWPEADGWVMLMRDVSAALSGPEQVVSRDQCRRLLSAAASVHDTFRGAQLPALCSLEDRCGLFSPRVIAPLVSEPSSLAGLVLRGWELFADIAPLDVVGPVMAILDRPSLLADRLRRSAESTLIHGDLWLVNVGLTADQVILLDWSLATQAPAALEFGSFLAGNASRIAATREEVIQDFRVLCGEHHDEQALRLGLLAGLVELGWNKGLDAVEHPDMAVRARESADLIWWVARAREALEIVPLA